MSFDSNWNIDKYRDDHECDEHWDLRRSFMERWKEEYSEERLVCLARVFANIEFMGCRYPQEVMAEVNRLSKDVATSYRKNKKTKLQRTFVSASDAAEDRAKGIKREGGVVVDGPPQKSSKIQFVPQGTNIIKKDESDSEEEPPETISHNNKMEPKEDKEKPVADNNLNDYMEDLNQMQCIDITRFRDSMFNTVYGMMVLVVRPWISKLNNITASCQTCGIPISQLFKNGVFSLTLNNILVAEASGENKAEARSIVEQMAWNRLKESMVIVVIKQQFLSENDSRISVSQISSRQQPEFGRPVEASVAAKMMKLMGWKGGGLGSDAQGIAEPIKPNFQMVDRAGLGSSHAAGRPLRHAAALMRRFLVSDADVDLVFSSDFCKDERAQLHRLASAQGLASRSYGAGEHRFLVVKKKLNAFGMVRKTIDRGGNTEKYQVFIPATLDHRQN